MSCDCSSGSSYDGSYGNGYNGLCNADTPYPSVSSESIPSLINNLTYALYGQVQKNVTNGQVTWTIPCDPSNIPATINNIPRNAGEGLLCYIIRALNLTGASGIVTVNGTQTLTNKTLTAPVINSPSISNLTATGTLALPVGSVTSAMIAAVLSTGSTTARTLQDRFADVVNVKDFGVVGDGVTDDTAALQAALDYAKSSYKSTVYIPQGLNILIASNDINIGYRTTLKGDLSATSPSVASSKIILGLKPSGTDTYSLKLAGVQLTLSGLCIIRQGLSLINRVYNPKGAQAELAKYVGTAISGIINDGAIQNCHITGFNQAIDIQGGRFLVNMIFGDNINGIKVSNCWDLSRIQNCWFWPFVAGGAGSDVTSTFTGNGSTKIYDLGSSGELDVIEVRLNGVLQSGSTYTYSSVGVLTFNTAPANGVTIAATRKYTFTYTGDGTTTTFNAGYTNIDKVTVVLVNNIVQPSSYYSFSGTNLVFSTAPASGESISIIAGGMNDRRQGISYFQDTTGDSLNHFNNGSFGYDIGFKSAMNGGSFVQCWADAIGDWYPYADNTMGFWIYGGDDVKLIGCNSTSHKIGYYVDNGSSYATTLNNCMSWSYSTNHVYHNTGTLKIIGCHFSGQDRGAVFGQTPAAIATSSGINQLLVSNCYFRNSLTPPYSLDASSKYKVNILTSNIHYSSTGLTPNTNQRATVNGAGNGDAVYAFAAGGYKNKSYYANGNPSTPTTVASGNTLGVNMFGAYDGTSFVEAVAMLRATVAGTVSTGIVPAGFLFTTTNASGVTADRISVDQNGNITPVTDNTYSLGQSGLRWSSVWAANGTIQTSDERTKKEITNSPLGLDFIDALRPVSYKFKVGSNKVIRQVYRDAEGNEVDANAEGANPAEIITEEIAGERTHYGLLAQEVKAALPEGTDFGGWILTDKNDPNSEQGLRYEEFISPLIKAVQELSARVKALESR